MRDAYLVPDHDWRQMGQAIGTLLHDRKLAGKLAAQARRTVLREFDWRRLCLDIEGNLDRLSGPKANLFTT